MRLFTGCPNTASKNSSTVKTMEDKLKSDLLSEDEQPTELEITLEKVAAGEVTKEEFLTLFLCSDLFIMINGEPEGDTLGDKKPMVIATGPDAPRMMAVFSKPHRAQRMVLQFPEYSFPVLVSAEWVFAALGSSMGVAFNPGYANGFEIAPEGAQQLKQAFQADQPE